MIRFRAVLLAILVCAAIASPVMAYFPEFTPQPWSISWSPVGSAQYARTGDIDGNGLTDFVLADGSTSLVVAMSLPAGDYRLPIQKFTFGKLWDCAVADVDGDGRADILATDLGADGQASDLVYIRSTGDGNLAAPVRMAMPFQPKYLATTDFNHDGHVDLLIRTADQLVMTLGDGGGRFTELSRTTVPWGYFMTTADLDGDTYLDAIMINTNPAGNVVYFGRPDGTFLPGPDIVSAGGNGRIAIADVDADADLDIVVGGSTSIIVIRNEGNRTLAPPVYVPTWPIIDAKAVAVGDFTGDGQPDLIASSFDSKAVAVLPGFQGGGFGAPLISGIPAPAIAILPLHVDDDASLDVALPSTMGMRKWANHLGANSPTLTSDLSLASEGQPFVFSSRFAGDPKFQPLSFAFKPPAPVGQLRLFANGQQIANTTWAEFDVVNQSEPITLPIGEYTITAEFEGDDYYLPSAAPPITVKVVAASAHVTLLCDTCASNPSYDSPPTFTADVTVDDGGSPTGTLSMLLDGVAYQFWTGAAPHYSATASLLPGTHTVKARYSGSSSHPPADSNAIQITVPKVSPTLLPYPLTALETTRYVRVTVSGPLQASDGTITVREGGVVLATSRVSYVDSWTDLTLPAMALGTHFLTIEYSGGKYHHPATCSYVREVVPRGPFVIAASRRESSVVPELLSYPAGYDGYHFEYKNGTAPWSTVSCSPLQVGVPCLVRAVTHTGSPIMVSNIAFVTWLEFTDDPLVPGVSSKAVHLAELLAACNGLRVAAGLSPISLPGAGVGDVIRASHLTTLLTATNEVLSSFGLQPASLGETIAPGTTIRASHIQFLREALR